MSWSWADEYGAWSQYAPDVCATLEAAFVNAGQQTVGIVLGRSSGGPPTHTIHLEEMEQVNVRTGFGRPVRRSGVATSSGSVSYQDERGRWVPYNRHAASQVCLAALTGRAGTTIYVPHTERLWAYRIDLGRMQQINTVTRMGRPIRFDPPAGVGAAFQPPQPHAAASSSAGGGGGGGGGSGGSGDGAESLPWQVHFQATSSASLNLAALTRWSVLAPDQYAEGATDPVMLTDLGEGEEVVVRLPCHTEAVPCTFNRSTVEAAFQSSNKCPTCGTLYGLPGAMPSGSMRVELDADDDCDGHRGVGTLVVTYDFRDGVQQPQHPQPNQRYHGTSRTCYLPNDGVGRQCLKLLRSAFLQGELFRVGKSSTTGRENVVVWAIHQKTSPNGGPTRHGWPDPEYLQRLTSECAACRVSGALDAADADGAGGAVSI